MRCFISGIFAFCACTLMTGCGGSSKGSVSGNVELDGAPIRTGFVHYHSASGEVFMSPLGKDGAYAVADVPTGQAKITVSSPDPRTPPGREGEKGPSAEELKNWVPIPTKYSDRANSGLTFDVKSGANTNNITLVGDGKKKSR